MPRKKCWMSYYSVLCTKAIPLFTLIINNIKMWEPFNYSWVIFTTRLLHWIIFYRFCCVHPVYVNLMSRVKKKKSWGKVSLINQGSDAVMGTNLHRQVNSMQMLNLPWVVKAFEISVKTGFTSFGKVDLPFHAPVSQQSEKTWRHSSTGLEFYNHQKNDFRAKKSSSYYLLFTLSPKFWC